MMKLTEEHFSLQRRTSYRRRTNYRTDDKKFCESLERHLYETKQEIERLRVALNRRDALLKEVMQNDWCRREFRERIERELSAPPELRKLVDQESK